MAKRDTEELEKLRDENAALRAEVARLRGNRERPALSCVNCGQAHTTIERDADGGYRCPVCGYVWAEAENLTPFRLLQRR